MTKKLFMLFVAFVCAATMAAQNIAVVSPSGVTTLYNTFPGAVEGAEDGSVVYLPGGVFTGCNINKKLTIIGVGYKSKTDNNYEQTHITGDLKFLPGSTGSALMGCFVSGTVRIGNDATGVNNVMIKHNNINNIQIYCSLSGCIINQNIVRQSIFGVSSGYANKALGVTVTNNISGTIYSIIDGLVSNNIATSSINNCARTTISGNIVFNPISYVSDCDIFNNMTTEDFGDDIDVGDEDFDWSNVFVNYNSNNLSNSDFHLKGEYKQYENQVGIYAGTGFNDKQLAPVPYIVAKQVDEQTDAQGKLNIRVRVKAGDTE